MGILDRHIEQADLSACRIDRFVAYADGKTRPHVRDMVEAREGGEPMRVVAVGDNGVLMVRDARGRVFNAPSDWFTPLKDASGGTR